MFSLWYATFRDRLISVGHVIHHLSEVYYGSRRRNTRRNCWLAALLTAVLLCCSVVWSVSEKLALGESATSVTIGQIDAVPSLYICPKTTTLEIVRLAGYDDCTFQAIKDILIVGKHYDDPPGYNRPVCDKANDRAALTDLQQMLLNISAIHRAKLDLQATGFKFGAIYVKSEIKDVVVSTGYCFEITLSTSEMTALEMQYSFFYLFLYDRAVFRSMGGAYLAVKDKDFLFRSTSLHLSTGYYILDIWITKHTMRSSKAHKCISSEAKKSSHCYFNCLAAKKNTQNNSCEFYNPRANQSLGSLCYRSDLLTIGNSSIEAMQQDCSIQCEAQCKIERFVTFY